MLLFLPILLLLLTAIAILIWQGYRPGIGVPWLAAVVMSLAEWTLLIFLRFRLPLSLSLKQWTVLGEPADFPYLLLDLVSWPYAFALAGLVLAVILTASARLAHHSSPRAWAGSLAIAAAGMLAVIAANPLTLAFAWAAIDLIELVVMLWTVQESKRGSPVVVAFAVRVVGIFVLVWAIFVARSRGITLSFSQVPPEAGIYLLLAAGLRLGVLPLHLPYFNELPMRRGVGNILRLSVAVSSLVLLARLPVGAVPAQVNTLLLMVTALAVFYTAVMWMFSSNEISGRPYWLVALAGMAVASVIRGQPIASIAWGLALMLPGGLLLLYSARQRQISFLPVLGALSLSGLPFSPAAVGWQGLWSTPFNFLDLLFLLAQAALLAGYLRHAFGPGDALDGMERWVQSVYPFGLFMLVVTDWLAAYLNLRGSFAVGNAWVGALSSLLALSGLALFARRTARSVPSSVEAQPGGPGWLEILAGRLGRALAVIFRLDWFYRIFTLAYGGLRRFITVLTTILEGEAGVLWAIVLLVLLISVLRSGGGAP